MPRLLKSNITIIISAASLLPGLIIFLTMLNGLYNSLEVAFGKGPPFDTFVFPAFDLFGDLAKSALSFPGPAIRSLDTWPAFYRGYFENNPYGGVAALAQGKLSNLHGMPLPTLILLCARYTFAFLKPRIVIDIFFLLTVAPFLVYVWVNTRETGARWIIAAAYVLSYPFLFAVTRGNITAIILGQLLTIAIVLTWNGKHLWLVSVILAVALNLRPNVSLLLVLPLVSWGIWRSTAAAAAAIAIAAVIFHATLTLDHQFYADYDLTNFIKAVLVYRKDYAAVGDAGLPFGSSLFGGIKLFFYIMRVVPSLGALEVVCLLCGLLSLAAWLLLVLFGHPQRTVSTFAIVAIYALFSGVFGDYHLIVFFSFILIFAQEGQNPFQSENRRSVLVAIAVLAMLTPKNYAFWHGLSLQILINPLVLTLAVLGIAVDVVTTIAMQVRSQSFGRFAVQQQAIVQEADETERT